MNWRGKRYLEMNMITMNYEIIQKKMKNIKILIPSVTFYSVKSVFFSLQVFV